MNHHEQLIDQVERYAAYYAVRGEERYFEMAQKAKEAIVQLVDTQIRVNEEIAKENKRLREALGFYAINGGRTAREALGVSK